MRWVGLILILLVAVLLHEDIANFIAQVVRSEAQSDLQDPKWGKELREHGEKNPRDRALGKELIAGKVQPLDAAAKLLKSREERSDKDEGREPLCVEPVDERAGPMSIKLTMAQVIGGSIVFVIACVLIAWATSRGGPWTRRRSRRG